MFWFVFQARIKAKPLLRSSFMPKNGFKQQYEQPAHTYTPQQRYAPFTPVPTTQYVISQQVKAWSQF